VQVKASVDFEAFKFERNVSRHKINVIRDEGLYRHIRFNKPDTLDMQFDLITWPGHLCYTGDMGTYVFKRLEDMFDFFRRKDDRSPYQIDFDYWAHKSLASDKIDGIRQWSPEGFREAVKDYFDSYAESNDIGGESETSESRKELLDELWDEIEGEVLIHEYDESLAFAALRDFDYRGFEFVDWEDDCQTWSHRFLWCCHALEWGVAAYDEYRKGVEVGQYAH
jgi:hypothetical protein